MRPQLAQKEIDEIRAKADVTFEKSISAGKTRAAHNRNLYSRNFNRRESVATATVYDIPWISLLDVMRRIQSAFDTAGIPYRSSADMAVFIHVGSVIRGGPSERDVDVGSSPELAGDR